MIITLNHTCFLDLNYSSNFLASKIADIPQKLKYETILTPILEFCFGTSDDTVWEYLTEEEISCYYDGEYFKDLDNSLSTMINLKIDWIRDETFLYSQIFNLVEEKVNIIARKFGLWNNKRFILNSLHVLNENFYPNDEFRNDRELMLQIVNENGINLAYASEELRNDRELVKQAVKRNGNALEYASDELKDDKEIVFIALESMNYAFKYASHRLKYDRDVVFKAVSQGLPVSELSEDFKDDRELLIMSSKINGYSTLKFACLELRNDKELVLQAIQNNPFYFDLASDELKNDREFVKEIVKRNGKCLRDAAREFQNDKEIVELALTSSPDAIYFISDRFRKDSEFISNLIGKRGFSQLAIEFSNDREIVFESIKISETNFHRASTELKTNREFILKAVKTDGMVLGFVEDEFKLDREIILQAVTQNGDALKYVPDQYFEDEEIILKAAQTSTRYLIIPNLFDKLSNRLKTDRDVIMKCGNLLRYFPRKFHLDREIVMEVVKTNPDYVLLHAYPLVVSDRVLAMRIVKRNGLLLRRLPFKYRNDRELALMAIQQNKEAFKFISAELQNDLKSNIEMMEWKLNIY